MAKNLGKVLACAAFVGTAVAGGMVVLNKYKALKENSNDDFEDFDDFDDLDDMEEDDMEEEFAPIQKNRGYVTIPLDSDLSAAEKTINE